MTSPRVPSYLADATPLEVTLLASNDRLGRRVARLREQLREVTRERDAARLALRQALGDRRKRVALQLEGRAG